MSDIECKFKDKCLGYTSPDCQSCINNTGKRNYYKHDGDVIITPQYIPWYDDGTTPFYPRRDITYCFH